MGCPPALPSAHPNHRTVCTFWLAAQGAVNSKVLHTPCISSAAASGCEQLEEDVGSEQQQADGQEEGDWQKLLWDVLSAAVPPIQFACSGKLSEAPPAPLSTFPDITVEGFGPLALPLSKEQAAALKAVAEQAPHGRGLRTVVDTAVRDAYQVGVLAGALTCLLHAYIWVPVCCQCGGLLCKPAVVRAARCVRVKWMLVCASRHHSSSMHCHCAGSSLCFNAGS